MKSFQVETPHYAPLPSDGDNDRVGNRNGRWLTFWLVLVTLAVLTVVAWTSTAGRGSIQPKRDVEMKRQARHDEQGAAIWLQGGVMDDQAGPLSVTGNWYSSNGRCNAVVEGGNGYFGAVVCSGHSPLWVFSGYFPPSGGRGYFSWLHTAGTVNQPPYTIYALSSSYISFGSIKWRRNTICDARCSSVFPIRTSTYVDTATGACLLVYWSANDKRFMAFSVTNGATQGIAAGNLDAGVVARMQSKSLMERTDGVVNPTSIVLFPFQSDHATSRPLTVWKLVSSNSASCPATINPPVCSKRSTSASCGEDNKCVWNDQEMICKCAPPGKDVVFLVDGSGSISSTEFSTQRQLVVDMITHMVPLESRIGVIQFATQVREEVGLASGLTAKQVASHVNTMSQLNGGTHIGDGLQVALGPNYLGSSQKKSKVIVLVTDGDNNGGVDPCSNSLSNQIGGDPNLKVVIVGVSSGFTSSKISCLVSKEANPQDFIVQMDTYSFAEFDKVAPEINVQVCRFQPA